MDTGSSTNGSGDDQNTTELLSSRSAAAFLAIGLFIGGLLVMLAMRRYIVNSRRRAGTWISPGTGPWNWEAPTYVAAPAFGVGLAAVGDRAVVGPTPALYDAHVVKAAGDKWEDIIPVSAEAEFGDSSRALNAHSREESTRNQIPYGQDTSHSPSGRTFPGMYDFVAQLRPSRRRPRSPSPPPPLFQLPSHTSPSDDYHLSARSDAAPTGKVPSLIRVALTITMPAERVCEAGLPPCALGIANVRWSGGSLDELRLPAAVRGRMTTDT